MSETIAKPIVSTGSYAVLNVPDSRQPAVPAAGGKERTEPGNVLPVPDRKPDLASVAEQLNLNSPSIGRKLRFEVDLASGHSVIQVLDRETGEIIRQIPPEDVTPYLAHDGGLAMRIFDDIV